MSDRSAHRSSTRVLLPVALAVLASLGLGFDCAKRPKLTISYPTNGQFVPKGPPPYFPEDITLTGSFKNVALGNASVRVNGVDADIQPNKTWSLHTFFNPNTVFNPYVVELRNRFTNQRLVKKRVTAIIGSSVADGAFSPQSMVLRFNDRGLNQIEPILPSLVGNALDINQFIQPGQNIGGGTVNSASIGGFAINADSQNGYLQGTTTVFNLFLDVTASTPVGNCGLHISAGSLALIGNYDLQPAGQTIDVNQLGDVNPVFGGFNHDFYSGICSWPLIEQIVDGIVGNLEAQVAAGLRDQLRDPDGGGPLDSPIAEGVEEGLSGIDIGGQVGALIGVNLETPGSSALEDFDGFTLAAHSRITSVIGTGPGQCLPPPGAPNLTRSLEYPTLYPGFQGTTPNNQPYGIGIGLSPSAFNQLLKASVECGLMNIELDAITLVPNTPPIPLTAALLASFDPAFTVFPPNTEFLIRVRPTLAPVLTDRPGPSGELLELRIGAMRFDIVEANPTVFGTVLGVEVDLGMGMNMGVTANGITPQISPPLSYDIAVSVVENPLSMNDAFFEALLPFLLGPVFPSLANTLGSFPLPSFLGVNLSVVQIARQNQFLAIFADFSL